MKILFLGARFQEWCGVSDFTRILAEELVKRGHVCALFGFQAPISEVSRERLPSGIERMNLPAHLSPDTRLSLATEYCGRFAPDALSLQFVNFSFHPYGFIHSLIPFVQHLKGKRFFEVFFHEIWIGNLEVSSLKERFHGLLQKCFIQWALRVWHPNVIHTQAQSHQWLLEQMGIRAHRMPLFGNVPRVPAGNTENPELQAIFSLMKQQPGVPVFVHFGNILKYWNLDRLNEFLNTVSQTTGTRPIVLFVGSQRTDGSSMFTRIIRHLHGMVEVRAVGRLSAQDISKLFQQPVRGLSSYPGILWDKSGAIAALLEHDLEVFVDIAGHRFRKKSPHQLQFHGKIFDYDEWQPARNRQTGALWQPLSDATAIFLEHLNL